MSILSSYRSRCGISVLGNILYRVKWHQSCLADWNTCLIFKPAQTKLANKGGRVASKRCNHIFKLFGVQGSIQVAASPKRDLPACLLQLLSRDEDAIPTSALHLFWSFLGWFASRSTPSFPCTINLSTGEGASHILFAPGMRHGLMMQSSSESNMNHKKRNLLSPIRLILISW